MRHFYATDFPVVASAHRVMFA